MNANWKILGHFYGNDDVANALNNAGVGVGAFAALNSQRTQFVVWGNDKSIVFPGYVWKSFGGSKESDLASQANNAGAVSSTATVNANGNWVLWCYVPQ